MTLWTRIMWKPIFWYAAIYSALFTTHIIAAANDLDMLFKIVAIIITGQTMLAGLCIHFLKGNVRHARIPVVCLAAGLGWAYAGMDESWTIALWVIGAIVLQIGTERGLKYSAPAESINV